MNAISLCGCTADGRAQDPLPYMGKGLFNCPKLTDVRIINLNNNDWNFAAAPELAKILMGIQMIIGRLGIYSILLVFVLYRKRA